MAMALEVPQLEPWFLVHWGQPDRPTVLMEFETQQDAEDALCHAFAEMVIAVDDEIERFPITVLSALSMLEDPELRDALAQWDAQLAELDSRSHRMLDEMFLEGVPEILRPRRSS